MRLTKKLREEILDNVLKVLDSRWTLLNEEGHQLAEAVYDEVIPERNRKLMNELPPSYFQTANGISISIDDTPCLFLRKNWGRTRDLRFKAPQLLPREFQYCVPLNSKEHVDLVKQVRAYEKHCAQLREDWRQLRRLAEGMLNSATTDKKLLEVWPEAVNYLPKPEAAPSDKPLMVLPNRLNDFIACAAKGNCS